MDIHTISVDGANILLLTISYIFDWPQDLEFELEWQEDNLLNPTQIMQSGKGSALPPWAIKVNLYIILFLNFQIRFLLTKVAFKLYDFLY